MKAHTKLELNSVTAYELQVTHILLYSRLYIIALPCLPISPGVGICK